MAQREPACRQRGFRYPSIRASRQFQVPLHSIPVRATWAAGSPDACLFPSTSNARGATATSTRAGARLSARMRRHRTAFAKKTKPRVGTRRARNVRLALRLVLLDRRLLGQCARKLGLLAIAFLPSRSSHRVRSVNHPPSPTQREAVRRGLDQQR